jgi:O-antigen/teichoic acid export membrane protein
MSAKPVLLLSAGRAVAFAATFATPLVLTRVLDQAEFGTYKQLFLVYATLAGIAQLGMAESLLYFLPFAPGRSGRYVLNALAVLASAGLGCLALLVLVGPRLGRWLGNDALPGLSGLLGIYLMLMLPSLVLEIVTTARKRYLGAAVAYGLSDLLRAAALVAPVLVSRRLDWLLMGVVAFAAVRLGATLLYLLREFGAELRPDRAALREQLAYALPFQLGVVLAIIVTNLHFYIVAASVDAAAFAIYAIGCLQIPLVDLLFTPASNVMMVRMREAISAQRPHAVLATWDDTTRKLALVFLPLVGLLLVTGRELILLLFTERYAASVPIFMVWSAAILFAVLQTDGVLRVYAKTRALVVLYALQLLVVAGLIPALMSAFGLIGAVLATVLATGLGKSLALMFAKRLMGATFAQILPWRSLGEDLGTVAVSALVALVVKTHLTAAPLPHLLVTSGVFVATNLGIVAARRAARQHVGLSLGRPDPAARPAAVKAR